MILDEVVFSFLNFSVNHIIGRTWIHGILGYELGFPFENFIRYNTSIESDYIDGVSLTYGPPGNRSHIWSFVAAVGEKSDDTQWNCALTLKSNGLPYTIPCGSGQLL